MIEREGFLMDNLSLTDRILEAASGNKFKEMAKLARTATNPAVLDWAISLQMFGIGKDKDALAFLERAAQGGVTHAMNNLARAYRHGLAGVKVNRQNALDWYVKSAEFGDIAGMEKAFELYLGQRKGFSRDIQKAYKWFRKALDLGSGPAKKIVEEYGASIDDLAKVSTVSFDDMAELADEGHPEQFLDFIFHQADEEGSDSCLADVVVATTLRNLSDRGIPEAAVILCFGGGLLEISFPFKIDFYDTFELALQTNLPPFLFMLSESLAGYRANPDLHFNDCCMRLARKLAATGLSDALEEAADIIFDRCAIDNPEGEGVLLSVGDLHGQWDLISTATKWLEQGMAQGDAACSVKYANVLIDYSFIEPGATPDFIAERQKKGISILVDRIDKGDSEAVIALESSDRTVLVEHMGEDELMSLLERSLPLIDDASSDPLARFARLSISSELGKFYMQSEDTKKVRSFHYLMKARDLARAMGVKEAEVEALEGLGVVYGQTNRPDRAIDAFRDAATEGSVVVLGPLGGLLLERYELHHNKNDLLEAKAWFGKAIEHKNAASMRIYGHMLLYVRTAANKTSEPLCPSWKVPCRWASRMRRSFLGLHSARGKSSSLITILHSII